MAVDTADEDNAPRANVHINQFGGRSGETTSRPRGAHGSKYRDYSDQLAASSKGDNNLWALFTSQIDWEVYKKLGLSYKTVAQLNGIIDTLPSPRPEFVHHQVEVAGKVFDFFSHDIIECIQALFGDPEHAQYLAFAPEHHYMDMDRENRVYHEMHTGKWWWSTQAELEKQRPGATIIPIILSSDKTQLMNFRNKSAYPVYLTIGSLPKSIRQKPSHHGQILLAYLPTARLTNVSNKSACRRIMANLFHACLGHIIAPLRNVGIDGIDITSGDGVHRQGHPILASYISDYPEQCVVTGAYNSDCPCTSPRAPNPCQLHQRLPRTVCRYWGVQQRLPHL
ncbi:hypothetical protein JVT61DRAFT_7877 [Boletus reticuloceps]|uniref:Uncharacterized protein n=1 Tax=Boletus reticuloceps TaxID=495285 RepID=A0A8I2YIC2_9AGAM|nr:hypothetical protein JVT61DRAFT_7877 [Boletus reticuloceps]